MITLKSILEDAKINTKIDEANDTYFKSQTCATWLVNCDRFKPQILEIFVHSPDHRPPIIQFNRWRMFFMACETLFAYNQGHEWFIGHYLFNKQ